MREVLGSEEMEKRLKDGGIGYYWSPNKRDYANGCPMRREALGTNYAIAIERAGLLNRHLDAWRKGRDAPKDLDLTPDFGSLRWLVERYKRSRAWEKVSERSRPEYERAFKLVLDYPTKTGGTLGRLPANSMSGRAADKLYVGLQKGKRVERRGRQANICIVRMARAWDTVQRLYPKVVPAENPFRGVELDHGKGTTRPATRDEAYALHEALKVAGLPHLAAVPLICFEWHQRPENVIEGHLTWSDYRPAERPDAVRIVHHKTGELVWLPLSDEDGPLFPELTAYLDSLERLGVPIVLLKPRGKKPKPARPFKLRDARTRVRRAAKKAELPAHLTFAACRHGGLTELGDAELTELGVMALSGHRTPEAARLYVKRTETQRMIAARKRRAWVESGSNDERSEAESQNGAAAQKSE
ncbi:MAG: hypothetical protein JSR99_10000 [Proteobacteria bacterium]|nr:hypothetical protein [Pseudomonadota bacterium]